MVSIFVVVTALRVVISPTLEGVYTSGIVTQINTYGIGIFAYSFLLYINNVVTNNNHMILILSKNVAEVTTEKVMDWIAHFNGKCLRLNGEDMISDTPITFSVTNATESIEMDTTQGSISSTDVNVVWFRRTINDISKHVNGLCDTLLETELNQHIHREFFSFYEIFHWHFRNANWLNDFKTSKINKINSLVNAKNSGLLIPDTVIVNSKRELQKVMDTKKSYITKALSDGFCFAHGNTMYPIYTEKFNAKHLDTVEEQLFPSLVQEYIEKDFEIRVFYFESKCYSMAIFSQQDSKTETDFRRYNFNKPNRSVPYKLPRSIEQSISKFMKLSNLPCGSLDLIKSKTGQYVFLEVNPVGQFGMVSYPCNYYLEEKIAKHLTALDN
jgi:ATP-GRASP peptide maturase of grasp-with-spasm system